MKLYFGYRTPSAALDYLTKPKGPYRWWGVSIGWMFIGVMWSAQK